MRTAIIHKDDSKVILCEGLYGGDFLILAVMSGHSINIQVSEDSPNSCSIRWIVSILNHSGKSISHMFADYIQKGNY